MRALEELAIYPAVGGGGGLSLHSWFIDCHGISYSVALTVPSVLFVAYLVSKARRSLNILAFSRSHIMIAYYLLLWIVSGLNLAWCLLQAWQCVSGKELAWNLLTLFTTSGMLFLEVSLVAFLLQGNHATGLEYLTKTFIFSGVITAAGIIVKNAYIGIPFILQAIYVFTSATPLFIDASESANYVKWVFLSAHTLLFTVAYGFILLGLHHSKWKESLPAKPAFYNYISAMFLFNFIVLFACILAGSGAGIGFWLYNLTTVCYHALYLPLTKMISDWRMYTTRR